jgi:hypothetical protein
VTCTFLVGSPAFGAIGFLAEVGLGFPRGSMRVDKLWRGSYTGIVNIEK